MGSGILLLSLFVILLLYVPYWDRFGKMAFFPIAYLPFLIIGLFMFFCYVVEGAIQLRRKDVPIIMFLIYSLIQPLFLWILDVDFCLIEWFKDFMMFLVYICIYLSATWAASNAVRNISIFKLVDRILYLLAASFLLSLVRTALIDVHLANFEFFNIFPPLGYRFFEVIVSLFSLAFSLALFVQTRARKYQIMSFLFFLAIVFSGSRTGLLTATVTVLVFMWLSGIGFRRSLSVCIMLAIVFFSAMAGILGKGIQNRIGRLSEVSMFVHLDFDEALEKKKDVKRLLYLTGGLQLIREHPFFGVGLGNFQEVFPYELEKMAGVSHVSRPHNMYISVGATAGLIGLVLIVLWVIFLLKWLYQQWKRLRDPYSLAALLFLFGLLVLWLGYETETNPIFWMLLGISVGMARGMKSFWRSPKIGDSSFYENSSMNSTTLAVR